MDPNTIEEALRAKEIAEKLFIMKDFTGAIQFAIQAQMAATFEIFASIRTNSNHEVDLYSIFGLDPSADKSVIKKRYKKMAVLLHPDKNKTIGADEAFRLVSETWAILSDNAKRNSHDAKRNRHVSGGMGSDSFPRLHTFWTVCTTCRVQYEYLLKYVNKRLLCKNCRGVFVAIYTEAAPVIYAPWPYTFENGYANQSCNTGNYLPQQEPDKIFVLDKQMIYTTAASETLWNLNAKGTQGNSRFHLAMETGSQNSIHQGNSSHEVGGVVSGQAPSISDMARGNMSSGGTHSYSHDHSAPSWNALYKRDSSPMMVDSDSVQQFVGSEFGRNNFSEVSSKA